MKTMLMTVFKWALVVVAVVALLGLAACDPKAEYGGKQLTEREVAVLVERENAAAVAAAQAKAAEIERQIAERTRAFERSLSRLLAEQNFEREDLADLYEAETESLREIGRKVIADAEAEKSQRLAAQAAHTAEIDRKWAMLNTLADWVEGGAEHAGKIPGIGPMLATGITLLGGGTGIVGLLGWRKKSVQASKAEENKQKIEQALGALAEITAMLPKDTREVISTAMQRFPDSDKAVIKEVRKADELHKLEELVDLGKLKLV